MKTPPTTIPTRSTPLFEASSARNVTLLLSMCLTWPAWGALSANNDGTVTDSTTQLIWDQCAYGLSGANCTEGSAVTATWTEALAIAQTANTNKYKGFTNWRLPNKNELASITRTSPKPAFNPVFFPGTPNAAHWTSTNRGLQAAWFVHFFENIIDFTFKTNKYNVRLVRDLPSVAVPAAPTIVSATPGDGSITVAFTPGSQGGAAIDNYRATCTGGKTGTSTTPSITVTGLANGTSYTCTVAAHNSGGWGIESEGVTKTPSTGPACKLSSAPDSLVAGGSATLTATGCDTATEISWTGGNCASIAASSATKTCIVTPNATTTYTVTGKVSTGTGPTASLTLPVYWGSCTLNAGTVSSTTGKSTLTASCTPAADSYVWIGGPCAEAESHGATCDVNPNETTNYQVVGIKGGLPSKPASFASNGAPVCTLTATPVVVAANGSSELKATCKPTATSYAWTGGTCAGTTAATCTVSPAAPTMYSVTGKINALTGAAATASVYVCNTRPSATYPGLTLTGRVLGETISSTVGTDTIDGLAGVDTVIYQCNKNSFTVTRTPSGWKVISDAEGTDALSNVERIQFGDEILALDISGNAGQTYRLYQAAFNRTPDAGGLKYWIGRMDTGTSLQDVAAGFVGSEEFKTLYGNDPSNADFLTKLYNNVLHRTPDQGGYDWWLGELNAGRYTKVTALMAFSEGPENQAGVLNSILNGIKLPR